MGDSTQNKTITTRQLILAYPDDHPQNAGMFVKIDRTSGGYPYATDQVLRATPFESTEKALHYAAMFHSDRMVLMIASVRVELEEFVFPTANKCVHCEEELTRDEWPVHTTGPQSGLHRCATKPYGYEGHPVTTSCTELPCRGAQFPAGSEEIEVSRG